MRILVLGGSGFVGGHLIPALLAEGHDVTVLNRGSRLVSGTRQLTADRRNTEAMRDAAGVGDFDVVIDTSAYRAVDTSIAVETFGSHTDHWLHLSSAAVYAESSSTLPKESAAIGGASIWGDYGREKSSCDQFLIAGRWAFQATILRPPYLYGPGNDNDRETFVWSRALRAHPVLVPGDGVTTIQFLHCADLALAFLACLERPATPGVAIYNVANHESLSLASWVRIVAASAGCDDPTLLVGAEHLGYPPRQYFPFRDHPCRVDATRISTDLGWRPATRFTDGLAAAFSTYTKEFLVARSSPSQAESAILAAISPPATDSVHVRR